jgi:glycosyltransferase involved in cell wall biosynthesis
VSGVKVYVNNPESLAWGITKVLTNDGYANSLRTNAYKKIQEKYDWDKIAQQTKAVYNAVLGEYSKSFWAQPIV